MRRRSPSLIWLAIAFLVLAVLSLMVAHFRREDALDEVKAMVARARRRPVEARLTGFPYGMSPRLVPVDDPSTIRLRSSAAEVFLRFEHSTTVVGVRTAGVAALVTNRIDTAVEELRLAVKKAPSDAGAWNDFSAALLTRASMKKNWDDAIEALASVDHALLLVPSLPEALCNRALILESIRLNESACTSWKALLQVESGTPWESEAKEAITRLDRPDRAAQWSNASAIFRAKDVDLAAIKRLTLRYPEESRRFAEATLLAEWGSLTLSGRNVEAGSRLEVARAIGSTLVARSREWLLADAVAAVDNCTTARCRKQLAEGHVAYDQARRLYSKRNVDAALPLFRTASSLLRQAGTPLMLVSDYYIASALDDRSDPGAVKQIHRLLATTPKRYVALRAQLLWEYGTIHERIGGVVEALDAFTEAASIFDRLGEVNSASRMRSSAASVEDFRGRSAEAWRLRIAAFDAFSNASDMASLQKGIELAARMEAIRGRWSSALALFDLVVEKQYRINQRLHVNALLWRGLCTYRTGHVARAVQQLSGARQFAGTIADTTLRNAALDDLTFAEASVLRATDPAGAASLLDRLIEKTRYLERTTLLPEIYLERARSALSLKDYRAAEKFFKFAITEAMRHQHESATRGVVDAYFATGTAAAMELAALLEGQQRSEEAFGVMERAGGQALMERLSTNSGSQAEAPDVEAIRRLLPNSTILVRYAVLGNQLVCYSLTRESGLRTYVTKTRGESIEIEIARFRHAIARNDLAESLDSGRQLDRFLMDPIRAQCFGMLRLVIVSDPLLDGLPFAALREPGGHFLIEDMSLIYAPNARVFTRSLRKKDRSGPDRRAVVIGNPKFNAVRFAALPPLNAAEVESRHIAGYYPAAVLLTGRDATVERVIRQFPSADVIHLATHAIVDRYDPMRSVLILAQNEGNQDVLYAADVARLHLNADVVVLAACRTAQAADTASDVNNLALTFLAAGARHVVGTLWDVDDEDTAGFSDTFHRLLSTGASPEEAIRSAQCQRLRTLPIRSWGAFTLLQ